MNGILLINKPIGITSHDVVYRVRRILHIKKVGHTGTLDPLAQGVLPICVGKATKIVEFLTDTQKQYQATLKLGITTDTQDITGEVLTKTEPNVNENELRAVIESFVGEIEQIPPMYSAIKHKGRKLYELARKGIEVEREPRRINIFGIEVIAVNDNDVEILVDCSKGTYIRTLCHDIGAKLGCGACMTKLIRTKSGGFSLEDCITLEELESNQPKLIPIDTIFAHYSKFIVNGELEKRILNGCKVSVDIPNGDYRVYNQNQEFLCISRANGGILSLIKALWM